MGTTKQEDRKQALEIAFKAIEKSIGKGAIVSNDTVPFVEFFSSGCLGLDRALGGGWGRGRIIEIFGPESCGKTTLCLHAVAEAQKQGWTAVFVDAEHALDPAYMKAIGIDMDKLIMSQPDCGEDALNVVLTLAKSNAVDLIIIDSVAALVPKAELAGEIGDSHVGRQARLMGQAMRMLAASAHNTNTTLMFINQIRMKVGIAYGNPETTPGGNALKFYASQRVDVRRTGGVKDGTDIVANATKVKVVKNKLASPFRIAEFEIRYGEGIDIYGDVFNTAIAEELIEKSGLSYSYNGEKFAVGLPKAKQFLRDNPKVFQELWEKLKG